MTLFIIRTLSAPGVEIARAKAYSSDDDGKTFFAGDDHSLPPFDDNGHEADLAVVYRCGGADPFVDYLIRYDATAKARIQAVIDHPQAGMAYYADLSAARSGDGVEVKKPGANSWFPVNSLKGKAILLVRCPDGSPAAPVAP